MVLTGLTMSYYNKYKIHAVQRFIDAVWIDMKYVAHRSLLSVNSVPKLFIFF